MTPTDLLPLVKQFFSEAIPQSFLGAIDDIVFGMQDGTVSIFGLVFGVGASAPDSRTVVLAGATGAAAAAVSMMLGTYLSVKTARDQALVQLAIERQAIAEHPDEKTREDEQRLHHAGFTPEESLTMITALHHHPKAWLYLEGAINLQMGDEATKNPLEQALWMFSSELFAASMPVLPFLWVPLGSARIFSGVITLAILAAIGIRRGIVTHRPLVNTIAETIGIAVITASAGLVIGKLVTH